MRIIDDITDFIFVKDEPRAADILFLPGGSSPEPAERGAELYRGGYAPLLLPSGGVSVKTGKFGGVKVRRELYNGDYPTDCAFYTDVLIKNGVPREAIVSEDRSGWTKENAFFSRETADKRGLTIRRALLCCKSFHARRCLMLYQAAFPEAEIFIVPADSLGIRRDNWYRTEAGVDRVLGELARCGNQFPDTIKEFLKYSEVRKRNGAT